VLVGMVAHGVPFFQQLLVNLRILLYVLTYTKKGAFGIVLLQLFQHKRRGLRVRAIVKSKVHRLFGR